LTAGNPFADRELCKEITCSGQFARGTHYVLASASPAYQQGSVPHLPWKWVRISRRIDAGPFPVGGTPAGQQVCWDGKHETTQPAACNPVYELTGFAQTVSGSREMLHMDVAMEAFSVPAAVTLLNGNAMLQRSDIPAALNQPSPNLMISGPDNNACYAGHPQQIVPAISVEDDIALDAVTFEFQPNGNFMGGISKEWSFGTEMSPNGYPLNTLAGIEDLRQSVQNLPGAQIVADCSTANFGDSTHPQVIVATNCAIGPENQAGYGLLWVTGTFDMEITTPGQSWHGIVIAGGQGICKQTVGFETQVTGAIICAPTRDSSGTLLAQLGKPIFTWKSAVPGLNEVGVQYDTCQIQMASRLLMGGLSYQEIGRRNIRKEWI
jgi:hypothetical protein